MHSLLALHRPGMTVDTHDYSIQEGEATSGSPLAKYTEWGQPKAHENPSPPKKSAGLET